MYGGTCNTRERKLEMLKNKIKIYNDEETFRAGLLVFQSVYFGSPWKTEIVFL